MPSVKTLSDVKNEFLARRELVCDFEDSAGRLRRTEAIEAVTAECGLEGKLVIPVRMQNHVGKTHVTGTFFVYEDEATAKAHIDSSIMERIEKSKGAAAEADKAEGDAGAPEGDDKAADTKAEAADGGEAKEAEKSGDADAPEGDDKAADTKAEAAKDEKPPGDEAGKGDQ